MLFWYWRKRGRTGNPRFPSSVNHRVGDGERFRWEAWGEILRDEARVRERAVVFFGGRGGAERVGVGESERQSVSGHEGRRGRGGDDQATGRREQPSEARAAEQESSDRETRESSSFHFAIDFSVFVFSVDRLRVFGESIVSEKSDWSSREDEMLRCRLKCY